MTDLYLDISHYQGVPDFGQIAGAGIAGVIAKLGGGDQGLYVDSQFPRNWQEIAKTDMHRGAYWFANPANGYGMEADYFLKYLPVLLPGDIVALDLETGSGDLRTYALGWLDAVEHKTGVTPWIYGNAYDLEAYLKADARFLRYPLWLAGYVSRASLHVPRPWTEMTAWQFTSSARVPGISGNVDQSHYYGSAQGDDEMTPTQEAKLDHVIAVTDEIRKYEGDIFNTLNALKAEVDTLKAASGGDHQHTTGPPEPVA